MRTSFATKPRKGSRVRWPIEASTPHRCNSSTLRERHCQRKPLRARYQPPLIAAAINRTIANRKIEIAIRRRNGGGPPRGDSTLLVGSMVIGIGELYTATDQPRFTQIFLGAFGPGSSVQLCSDDDF